MQKQNDFVFKILLIGNSPVGKSSIVLRFTKGVFKEKNSLQQLVQILVLKKLRRMNHQFNYKFGTQLVKNVFRNSIAYIIKEQMEFLQFTILLTENHFKMLSICSNLEKNVNKDVVRVIVGNKSDLESQREVTFEEGIKLAGSKNARFIETSAKSPSNVDEAFITLANEIIAKVGKWQNL